MSFKLADLFVQVSVRGVKATQNSVGSLRAHLGEFTPLLGGLQLLSSAFLATFTTAGVAAAYSMSQAENSTMALAAAMENVHEGGTRNREWASAFATDLESKTVLSRYAVMDLMTTILKLGGSMHDVQTITKSGIGLGEMYFNGDAEAGVKALTLAQQGNFRQLQRLIPELKGARTQQEALNIVMEKAKEGLSFANERANTFGGALTRMRVSIENAGVALGQLFVPYLREAAEFIQKVATYITHLDEAQKALIIRLALVGAGFAALIVFGPPLLAFFGAIVTAMVGLVEAITDGFVFLIVNPIGEFIAALAGIVVAIAYVIGEGDKAVDRIASGLLKIVDFLDPVLGSFEGLAIGIKFVWAAISTYITDVVISMKSILLNIWENIAEEIEQVWWSMFAALNRGWDYLKVGAKSAMAWLRNAWEQTTNEIANKLAYVMQRVEVTSDYRENHPDASDAEVDAAVSKEMAIRKKYLDKQTSDANSQAEKDYDTSIKRITSQYDAEQQYMQKQITDQVAADKARRQGNRNANDNEAQHQIEINHRDLEARWEAEKKKLEEMPKLSEKIAALYKQIHDGLGVDEATKQLNELIAQFNKLKVAPGDIRDGSQGSLNSISSGQPKTTSIQDAFKKAQVEALIGHELAQRDREDRKKAEDERRKQHNLTNKHLSAMNDQLQNIGLAGAMV